MPSGLSSLTAVVASVILPIVFSKLKLLNSRQIIFKSQKREGVITIVLLALLEILTVAILLFVRSIQVSSNQSVQPNGYTVTKMLTQLTIEAIILAPFVAAVVLRRQDLSSMGITRHNFAASTAIGLLLSLINVIGSAFGGSLTLGLSGLYSLIAFTSVGFVEEAIFRGYVQLRFSSWLGGGTGWIAATILFTLWHIPQELLVKSVSNDTTLIVDLIFTFIPGLLFGWIMKRTQSIIAPALWHTIIDWSGGL